MNWKTVVTIHCPLDHPSDEPVAALVLTHDRQLQVKFDRMVTGEEIKILGPALRRIAEKIESMEFAQAMQS